MLNVLERGEFQNSSGAYAFMIDWPTGGTDIIRWEQDTNPFDGFGTVSNRVDDPVGQRFFEGLGPAHIVATAQAVLDGNNRTHWWHTLGTETGFLGLLRAYANDAAGESGRLLAERTWFWVRPYVTASCQAVFAAIPDAPDGTDTIDVSGPTGFDPFELECTATAP